MRLLHPLWLSLCWSLLVKNTLMTFRCLSLSLGNDLEELDCRCLSAFFIFSWLLSGYYLIRSSLQWLQVHLEDRVDSGRLRGFDSYCMCLHIAWYFPQTNYLIFLLLIGLGFSNLIYLYDYSSHMRLCICTNTNKRNYN